MVKQQGVLSTEGRELTGDWLCFFGLDGMFVSRRVAKQLVVTNAKGRKLTGDWHGLFGLNGMFVSRPGCEAASGAEHEESGALRRLAWPLRTGWECSSRDQMVKQRGVVSRLGTAGTESDRLGKGGHDGDENHGCNAYEDL